MSRFFLADTETTGVSETDKVCEVAWIEISEDFEILAKGYSLINPEMPIHYAASAVNGITDEMVQDAPTIEEYMLEAGYPLRGEDVVFIAHNAPFDYRFLSQYMSEDAITLDTLRVARILYPEAANHKQGTLAAMLGIQVDRSKAHAADGDLEVLLQLLMRMCSDAECGLEGLLEVQKRKRQILTMPFGKHKGTPLKDLPKSYVSWLLNAANVDDDLRASLMAL